MTGPDTTEAARRRDEADDQVGVCVGVHDLSPDYVMARPMAAAPGRAVVYLAGSRIDVEVTGDLPTLRAVVVEIDRQLAQLEVEARIVDITDTGAGR